MAEWQLTRLDCRFNRLNAQFCFDKLWISKQCLFLANVNSCLQALSKNVLPQITSIISPRKFKTNAQNSDIATCTSLQQRNTQHQSIAEFLTLRESILHYGDEPIPPRKMSQKPGGETEPHSGHRAPLEPVRAAGRLVLRYSICISTLFLLQEFHK